MCKLWLFLTRPANAVYSVGIHVMSVLSSRHVYIVFFAGLFLCISFTGDGRREPGAGRGETGKGRQEKGEGRLETSDGRQNTWWWGRQGVTTNLVHVGGFGLRVIDTLTRTMPQVPSSGLFPIQNTHLQLRNAQNCELQNSLLSHWEDYTGSGPFHILIVQLSFVKKRLIFWN